MSTALAETYECPPPSVTYNAFPWADRASLDGLAKDRAARGKPSIHWVSQMIGPGRGLEDLFASLPFLKNDVEIHLRGNRIEGLDAWLRSALPAGWNDRVFFHGVVSNEELLSRIAEHDIGFAGEIPFCANKRTTVSNKILHYLLGGLAVVASDTPGQREVAEMAQGAISLYPSGDASALARRIDTLLETPQALSEAKLAALRAAQQTFCWEHQEATLLKAVTAAIGSPVPAAT